MGMSAHTNGLLMSYFLDQIDWMQVDLLYPLYMSHFSAKLLLSPYEGNTSI